MKDLISTFTDIGRSFSLFYINVLSLYFDELQSLISTSKNDFQIIGISEIRLEKSQETRMPFFRIKMHYSPFKTLKTHVIQGGEAF